MSFTCVICPRLFYTNSISIFMKFFSYNYMYYQPISLQLMKNYVNDPEISLNLLTTNSLITVFNTQGQSWLAPKLWGRVSSVFKPL